LAPAVAVVTNLDRERHKLFTGLQYLAKLCFSVTNELIIHLGNIDVLVAKSVPPYCDENATRLFYGQSIMVTQKTRFCVVGSDQGIAILNRYDLELPMALFVLGHKAVYKTESSRFAAADEEDDMGALFGVKHFL